MLLASVGLFAFGLASLYQGGNLAVSLDRPAQAAPEVDERVALRNAAQDYLVGSQLARLSEAARARETASDATPGVVAAGPVAQGSGAAPVLSPGGETPVVPTVAGVVPELPRVVAPPAARPSPEPVAAAPPATSPPPAAPAAEPAPAPPARPEPVAPPSADPAEPSEPAPPERLLDPVLDALLGQDDPSGDEPGGGLIPDILGFRTAPIIPPG